MHDSQGEGTMKKLLERRLNFVDGTISSHCGVLNSPERLALIRQAHEVSAVIANLKKKAGKERREKAKEGRLLSNEQGTS